MQWMLLLCLILPIGFYFVHRINQEHSFFNTLSAWLGLLVLIAFINFSQFFLPASSPLIVCSLTIVSLVAFIRNYEIIIKDVKKSFILQSSKQLTNRFLTVAIFYLANLTLAPVGNDDSPLYHLGLVRYFSEHSIIPGLANIHIRFGLSSSIYPLSAFFESGFWGSEGFRLGNGFILLFLLFECTKRIRRILTENLSPGDALVVIATPLIMTIAVRDPWTYISSPSPDLSSAIVIIVAFAFSLDAFHKSSDNNIAAALALTALAATFRPLNLYAFGIIFLLALFRIKSSAESRPIIFSSLIPVTSLLATFVAQSYVITGYLIFPSTFTIFHPKWQVPYQDAKGLALLVSSWARGMRPLFSTSWFVPVLSQSKQDFYPLVFILISTGLLLYFKVLQASSFDKDAVRLSVRGSISIGGTFLIWLIGAPTPRFGWGVLYTLAIFPLSILLVAQINAAKKIGKVLVISLFVMLMSQASWIPLQYGTALVQPATAGNPYGHNLMPKASTDEFVTDSGLIVYVPKGGSDSCYRKRLCTAELHKDLSEITVFGRRGYSRG
jgi:hypothetical protein